MVTNTDFFMKFLQGSSAVDFLMDSKWATGKTKSTVEFTHRESVTIYLQR